VHFLDLHACMTTNEMYDALHPNALGYSLMATNTFGWLPAITNIIGTNVVANQPAAIRAVGLANRQSLTISFNKKVSYASATNLSNYVFSGGLTPLNATLNASQRTVTLTTTIQTKGTTYTVTLNGIEDETAPAPLAIPAGTLLSFVGQTPRGYLNNVSESTDYTLVYSLDLPSTSDYRNNVVPYSVDNSGVVGNFTRVAYYLELQKTGEDLQYVWASMDAFTNRADKLGLPTLLSGVVLQRYVSNLNVFCNVSGVTTGTGLAGNIEFWPYDYSAANAKGIPGANASTYDFGDQCSFANNYSCMQVHNYAAGQTLFALNHWHANATLEIGIGNQPTGNPDWTFNGNAGSYTVKTLQVLVLRDTSDAVPPTPVAAQAGYARNLVTVTFSEPLAASSVNGARFTLDNGVAVLNATLLADLKTVNLLTTHQPFGASLTLTVNGVRDICANATPPGTTVAVAAPALPAEVVANAGALAGGYELVYTLDIPVRGTFNASSDPYRYNQCTQTGAYDRVAYYLELQTPSGAIQYLWASMDDFASGNRTKIGLPSVASGAVFQRYVSNLDVKSNVAGVTNGTGMAGGNLEFWPSNYSATNTAAIPGASHVNYDFGDSGGTASSGHGSMQLHNSTYGQTLFAMNNWGGDGNIIAIGIGNRPGQANTDWTFADNSGTYARRTLHVLARPAQTPPPLPPDVQANVPEAAGYQHAYTINVPVNGSFNTNTPAYFAVNNYTNGLPAVFSRIAYYLELQSGSNPTQWIWTAMDAFTSDARKIAVPTNNCYFQQKVTRLDVRSNVDGIVSGSSFDTGNVEIWPSSYTQANAIGIPNASASYYDFGDGGASGSGGGYGSMQVHNHGAGITQVLFAVNNFNANNHLCVGIGNRPGSYDKDWTHAYNASTFNHRRLHVFVLPGGDPDVTRPTLFNAAAARSLNQLAVGFSETLADASANPAFFALNNGATVLAASLSANRRDIILTTSALVAGQSYTLTVTGVRDRSSNGNPISPGSAIAFTAPTSALPSVLSNVAETASYELIHQLAIGDTVNWQNGCTYSVDESKFPRSSPFDRVAYCLEVVTNGVYKWVYVSMNAFTADITKIGVPTADRGAIWQQYVSNLNVYASASVANLSVTTGVGIAAGNLEFWPSNYGGGNDKNIPGALGAVSGTNYFDFGDGGGPNGTSAGHGSMQIHNYAMSNTIFALNSFGTNGRTPAIGIGNNTFFTGGANLDPDWTFYYNARQYTTKNLYVLARPGVPAGGSGTPAAVWNQPRSQTIRSGEGALFSVFSPTATAYQWRKNGQWIAGATLSWLEINPADLADGGTYDVLVYGTGTATTASQSALLTVLPLGTVFLLQ
jgi:hypothetical protein